LESLEAAVQDYGSLNPEGKCELIRYFKVAKCYKQENSKVLMSFSPSPAGQKLRTIALECLKTLDPANKWEAKLGRSPAGHLERDLQAWLVACSS
jgi:hypothetical protein